MAARRDRVRAAALHVHSDEFAGEDLDATLLQLFVEIILQRTAEEVAPKLARDFTPDMYRNDVADRLFKVATGTFSTPSEMPFDALFDALKELADV